MVRFHVRTTATNPGLHVWRESTPVHTTLRPVAPAPDADGWWTFSRTLDPAEQGGAGLLLVAFGDDGNRTFESEVHRRTLPRLPDGSFPEDVWLLEGAARVLTEDPARSLDMVRIHLLTARRYRDGALYLWVPGVGGRRIEPSGSGAAGPDFDIALEGREAHAFCFKFVQGSGEFEPDQANRVWGAGDGGEVWTHSGAPGLHDREPVPQRLRLHVRHELGAGKSTWAHLWQEASDFITDVEGVAEEDGWARCELDLYTGLPYRVLLHNPALPEAGWEAETATRDITIAGPGERWTLEGDPHLFDERPALDRTVRLQVTGSDPSAPAGPYTAEVRVGDARAPLHERVEASEDGVVSFATFPQVRTAVRLRTAVGGQQVSDHAIRAPQAEQTIEGFVLAGRPAVLTEPPRVDLFTDPPFLIERPGVVETEGRLRFALHAPSLSRVQVVGDWTDWRSNPLELRSTRDGAYWWGEVAVQDVVGALGGDDYHGVRYKLLLDGERLVHDPAADWVESSSPDSASRIVRHSGFQWSDGRWRAPGWDHLIVYQVHPARFSGRGADLPPLLRVAREVEDSDGYLRRQGITALLLMPVNEVASTNSWGYDPAFFYAVESSYGGPDALKQLVDICHRHGLAVLLDVVFNHAGTQDNVLWPVARDSFFDGDTQWGAMIDFDQPQCRHFFEQNLVYFQREFHIDGFRLDHTHTIVHGDRQGDFVRTAGSGGGWEFLHGLRAALHRQADPRCILTAEHLPNEWTVTNHPGPMDSQWCDDFHDRLLDACRGLQVMDRLADALMLSHSACDDWYKVTNYPESHDEAGNDDHRIARVAGEGRGLRMTKVAGAVTLLGRGIPMWFMGCESGETRQFRQGDSAALDLDAYLASDQQGRVREWWNVLCKLHDNPNIKGPSPLRVHYARGQTIALSRGMAAEYFVVCNFGWGARHQSLAELGLPDGVYRELWNSTWPAFAVEFEDEHTNGGRDAHLHRGLSLHVPDYGVIVLERR